MVLLAGRNADRAAERGVHVAREAFADLEYEDNGHIIIEPDPQAKDPEACAEQAIAVLRGEVTSVNGNGNAVAVDADTICVHGDRPNAVDIATPIRRRLAAEGVTVSPMSEVLARRR